MRTSLNYARAGLGLRARLITGLAAAGLVLSGLGLAALNSTAASADTPVGAAPATSVATSSATAAGTPDTSLLTQLIASFGNFDTSAFTPDSLKPVASAVIDAEALLRDPGDATQAEVDAAVAELIDAASQLKAATTTPQPTVTVTVPGPTVTATDADPEPAEQTQAAADLGDILAALATFDPTRYTPASAGALTQAMTAAKALLATKNPTAVELEGELRDIAAAAAKLVPVAPAAAAPAANAAALSVLASHRPAIKGTVKHGRTVRVNTYRSKWTAGTKLVVKWYVNGKKVAATAKLKLKSSYTGKKLVVKVTGTQSGYKAATRSSKAKKIR
ncbi:MAG: hypothetical protein LBM66_05995 [Bifidobacteriaceae bacterium]|jgi:hypothetical protein|nr:hypothetical protein [Bifidobacteriaceae bacterium]